MKKNTLEYKIQDFHKDSTELAELIRSSSVKYDAYISMMRGGLMPSMYIIQRMNSREISFIGGRFDENNKFTLDYIPLRKFKGNILLISDLVKSGKTIQKCIDYLKQNSNEGIKTIDLAAIHYFPTVSSIAPKYFIHEYKEDLFIEFPWDEYSHFD